MDAPPQHEVRDVRFGLPAWNYAKNPREASFLSLLYLGRHTGALQIPFIVSAKPRSIDSQDRKSVV